jgi:hypothetical protein
VSGVIFRAIGRQVVGVAKTCVAACKACMRQPLGVSCASALLSQPVSGRSVLLAKRVHVLPFHMCVCDLAMYHAGNPSPPLNCRANLLSRPPPCRSTATTRLRLPLPLHQRRLSAPLRRLWAWRLRRRLPEPSLPACQL